MELGVSRGLSCWIVYRYIGFVIRVFEYYFGFGFLFSWFFFVICGLLRKFFSLWWLFRESLGWGVRYELLF